MESAQPATRRRRDAILGLLLVTVVAGITGFQLGSRNAVTIRTGRADSAEGAISITTDDWTYGVPVGGVAWTDQSNIWHEDGRPTCLAPDVGSHPVRFASVEATIDGSTWRPVVWVDCRGVP
jgi:hypothetical protein